MNRSLSLSALFLIAGASLSLVGLTGCGGSDSAVDEVTTAERFEKGMAELEDGDYQTAAEQFEVILLQDPASEYADDAQYYLGETHYRNESYKLAAFHFNRVTRDFPSSPHYKRALYLTGECYYEVSPQFERDQTETENAIRQFEAFRKIYPRDSLSTVAQDRIESLRSKLAHRLYYIADHYMNRDEYEAAEIYFQRLVDEFPGSEYYSPALEGLETAARRHQEREEERALSRK